MSVKELCVFIYKGRLPCKHSVIEIPKGSAFSQAKCPFVFFLRFSHLGDIVLSQQTTL